MTKREHSTIHLRVLPARTIASHDSTSNHTPRTPGHDPRCGRSASPRFDPILLLPSWAPPLSGTPPIPPPPPLPTPRPYTSQPLPPRIPRLIVRSMPLFHRAPGPQIPPPPLRSDAPGGGRGAGFPPTRYKYPTTPATPREIPRRRRRRRRRSLLVATPLPLLLITPTTSTTAAAATELLS